jgi:cysteinyl-tRNA synthetase
MKLYNSLTRQLEEFKPLNAPNVTMYFCGPTVYHYATIGNLRTYLLGDLLFRALSESDFAVKYAVNITDVGHLVSDADEGEDRMEKGARREGKSVWDVAKYYTDAFLEDYNHLNLSYPTVGENHPENPIDHFVRATNHIQEQVEMVKKLEQKGLTYIISDGVYFDTSKDPDYGALSLLDRSHLQTTERVDQIDEKKHPEDFALWKFSPKNEQRLMEWDSPWGKGFPGWHIECSAMSMKYLGETIDIHGGGEDLRMTHHPNEIAQSEAVTEKRFVNYWIHGAFILVESQKMSKSLGNVYRVQDVVDRGFNPLALRYLYMTSHYRTQVNFTWDSLSAAQNTLTKLYTFVSGNSNVLPLSDLQSEYYQKFIGHINNDLDTPKAIAVLHEVINSDLNKEIKIAHLLKFDSVLGLKLSDHTNVLDILDIDLETVLIDGKSLSQVKQDRDEARARKDYKTADEIRDTLKAAGYEIEDTSEGTVIKKS